MAELRDIDAINAELELTMPDDANQPASDDAVNELTAQENSELPETKMDNESGSIENNKPPVAELETEMAIEAPLTAES